MLGKGGRDGRGDGGGVVGKNIGVLPKRRGASLMNWADERGKERSEGVR